MRAGKERRERQRPISMLPDMKNISPEFTGIFLVIAVVFIVMLYWKPFSQDSSTKSPQETERANQSMPVPPKAPTDTVLIREPETKREILGEFPADYQSAEMKLKQTRDYCNEAGIALDEYKKGSTLKTEWMSESKTGVAVMLSIEYDAGKSVIVASKIEKRADENIRSRIDSRALFERIAGRILQSGIAPGS